MKEYIIVETENREDPKDFKDGWKVSKELFWEMVEWKLGEDCDGHYGRYEETVDGVINQIKKKGVRIRNLFFKIR